MVGLPQSTFKRPLRDSMKSPAFSDINGSKRYTLLEGGYATENGICYVDMVLRLNQLLTAQAYTNDVLSLNYTGIHGFPVPKNVYNCNFLVSFLILNRGYQIDWYDKIGNGEAALYKEQTYNGDVTLGMSSRVTLTQEMITNQQIVVHITGEYEV